MADVILFSFLYSKLTRQGYSIRFRSHLYSRKAPGVCRQAHLARCHDIMLVREPIPPPNSSTHQNCTIMHVRPSSFIVAVYPP